MPLVGRSVSYGFWLAPIVGAAIAGVVFIELSRTMRFMYFTGIPDLRPDRLDAVLIIHHPPPTEHPARRAVVQKMD